MEGRRAPTFIKISFVLPKFGESVVLLLLAVCVHFGLLVMTTLDNCHELQNAACTVHTTASICGSGDEDKSYFNSNYKERNETSRENERFWSLLCFLWKEIDDSVGSNFWGRPGTHCVSKWLKMSVV